MGKREQKEEGGGGDRSMFLTTPFLFPSADWQSKLERSGKSPLQDPAAIIGLMAIW